MFTVEFKNNSLHKQFVDCFFKDKEFEDLCTYIRYFLYSILLSLGCLLVCVVIAIIAVIPIAVALINITSMLGLHGFSPNSDATFAAILGVILYTVVYLASVDLIRNWYYIKKTGSSYDDYIENKRYEKEEAMMNKEPSFFNIFMQTLREKTCFRLKFTE